MKANRTLVPVQITLKLDDELHPSQILMIVLDETDIRNLEDAHKNLVNNSAQGMWLFREEELVFANSKACKILGCSVGGFLGYNAHDFLPMIDESHWNRFLRFFETSELKYKSEKPVQLRFNISNRELWLELFPSASNFIGYPALQVTFVDITERIHAAEMLKKSEE